MLWYTCTMKCKRCGSENIIRYGPRRGKQCYWCKNCGHQFTNEISKYNDFDKYIAICLYYKNTRYKLINKFIKAELRLSHIAKILNAKYSTVDYWVNTGKKNIEKVELLELIEYLKKRENGKDILGLLFPNKVRYQPSETLLKIIKRQK